MVYTEYTWIFVVGIFFAFFAAFGIGANDVANSFGSSVGTKALAMWQAVIIAGIMEFLGAFLLGAGVTDTIKGGIANTSSFSDSPGIFMYGFLCVLMTAAFWDNAACHLELPVSTTHTTVGAVVGFALVAGGTDAVIWVKSKDEFPFFSGFLAVIASWFVSPVCSGIVVCVVFFFLRTFVLRSKHSFTLSFWLLPIFMGCICGLICGFIIQVGSKNNNWEDRGDGFVTWVSAIVAAVAALFTLVVVMPIVKRKALKDEEQLQARIAKMQAAKEAAASKEMPTKGDSPTSDGAVAIDMAGPKDPHQPDAELVAKAMYDLDMVNDDDNEHWTDKVAAKYNAWVKDSKFGQIMFQNPVARTIGTGLFYNVHDCVEQDSHIAEVWANAEVFDFKTERLYRYLQVFSAAAMAFAHGSNDVANAMGPLSAIYTTWDTGAVPGKKMGVPDWILALGGAGLTLGLATFGYKIMRVLGVKSVKLTNVRGFVVEWATALTVCVASRYGLPVSTTQVVSGAILSMGMWEGRRGVNWRIAFKIFGGWILTIFIACGVCAALTSIGVFTPNKNATYNENKAANTINQQTLNQIMFLNQTGAVPESQLMSLNDTLTDMYLPVTDITGTANLQVQTFDLYNSTVMA